MSLTNEERQTLVLREKSDYNCFFDVSQQDIEEGIAIAEEFINEIEKYIDREDS